MESHERAQAVFDLACTLDFINFIQAKEPLENMCSSIALVRLAVFALGVVAAKKDVRDPEDVPRWFTGR